MFHVMQSAFKDLEKANSTVYRNKFFFYVGGCIKVIRIRDGSNIAFILERYNSRKRDANK